MRACVCVYIHICVCMRVLVYIYMRKSICVYMCEYIYAGVCVQICMYICGWVCILVYVCGHIYVCEGPYHPLRFGRRGRCFYKSENTESDWYTASPYRLVDLQLPHSSDRDGIWCLTLLQQTHTFWLWTDPHRTHTQSSPKVRSPTACTHITLRSQTNHSQMDVLPAHLNRDSFRDSFKGLVALEIIFDLPFGSPINNIICLSAGVYQIWR